MSKTSDDENEESIENELLEFKNGTKITDGKNENVFFQELNYNGQPQDFDEILSETFDKSKNIKINSSRSISSDIENLFVKEINKYYFY